MRVRLLVVRVMHVVIEGLERYRSSSKLWGGNGEVERDDEREAEKWGVRREAFRVSFKQG